MIVGELMIASAVLILVSDNIIVVLSQLCGVCCVAVQCVLCCNGCVLMFLFKSELN